MPNEPRVPQYVVQVIRHITGHERQWVDVQPFGGRLTFRLSSDAKAFAANHAAKHSILAKEIRVEPLMECNMTLDEAICQARKNHHMRDGKCAMCASGDIPKNGLHHNKYWCGNNDTCVLCHNSGMKYGEQCKACGGIEKL